MSFDNPRHAVSVSQQQKPKVTKKEVKKVETPSHPIIRTGDLFSPASDDEDDLFKPVHPLKSPNVCLFDPLDLRGPLRKDEAQNIILPDALVAETQNRGTNTGSPEALDPVSEIPPIIEPSPVPKKPQLPTKPEIPTKPTVPKKPQISAKPRSTPKPPPRQVKKEPVATPRTSCMSESDIASYIQKEAQRQQTEDIDLFS